jgi:hypothetical protein
VLLLVVPPTVRATVFPTYDVGDLSGDMMMLAAQRPTDDRSRASPSSRRPPRASRAIRTAIDAAVAGHGQLVLVHGPIARKRLKDAIDHAARGAALVARDRCMPADVPLAPWTRLLSSFTHGNLPAARPCSRFERFAEVLEALGAATHDRPAVVVLEDLHHADRASLLLLEMLARTLPDRPLAVIAAYRDVSSAPGHPLTESLAELLREPATVHLALRTVPSHARASDARGDAVFRRTGDDWTLAFEGDAVRIPDSQGLRYLAALLRRPWERIPVQAIHATTESVASARRRKPVSAERARLAVTKAIKAALAKITIVHPALARHLGATVRRGHFCSYTPDPRQPVVWDT